MSGHMPEAQLDPDDYWERPRKKSYLADSEDCDIRAEELVEESRECWNKQSNFGIDCNTKH